MQDGNYVDGFVVVVPDNKTDEYKEAASMGRDMWMRHGALAYFECKGNDMARQDMGGEKTRAFTEMAGAKDGETVWFSFIVFKSKEHRDEVNAKVIEEMQQDQAQDHEDEQMPFDMKRMAYGGFEAIVKS